MKRNALRIVCNSYTNQLSYYFRNEMGEWIVLSGSSPLSRQFYTKTTIKERQKEIVGKIDEIYNRKNKGLDIFFEGTSQSYHELSEGVKKYLPDRDITCRLKTTKIAVAGKKSVGKSSLIEGMEEIQKCKYKKHKRQGYTEYIDEDHHIQWLELKGIDVGKNNVEAAFSTIELLASQGLSTVIYCVSGVPGRMEDIEKDFIIRLDELFAGINVLTVLTMCYQDNIQPVIDEIEKITKHMEVFPVLAQKFEIGKKPQRSGTPVAVEPFGLQELYTYILEGRKLPRAYQVKKPLKPASGQKPSKQALNNNAEAIANNPFGSHTEARVDKQLNSNARTGAGTGNPLNSNTSAEVNETGKADYSDAAPQSEVEAMLYARNGIAGSAGHSSQNADCERREQKSVAPEQIAKSMPVFTKVAVAGMIGVGKSTVIESLEGLSGNSYCRSSQNDYILYEDEKNHIQLYEVKGIDLGRDKVEEAFSTVRDLASSGLSSVLYCISGGRRKIEQFEIDYVKRLTKQFPMLKVAIVLTMCYMSEEELQEIIDAIKEVMGQIEVLPVLAKDFEISARNPKTGLPFVIESFGMEGLSRYIFEEK